MQEINKNKKLRRIFVTVFIILFMACTYIVLRGNYLEYKELGESYVQEFKINCYFKYTIMAAVFVLLYLIIYIVNRGIKKGLKEFFDKEQKQMPKLPNKSIAFVLAILTSVIVSNSLAQNVLLFMSNASFGKTDMIFNLDIGYYIFQKPLIEQMLNYVLWLIVGITIYTVIYYIITLNKYFDGVERQMIRKSKFIRTILRNVLIISVLIGMGTILKTQNIVFGKILTIDNSATTTFQGTNNDIELTGANYTAVTIQRWGYTIFGIIIIIAVTKAVKNFKKENTQKIIKSLSVIPIYLIALFVIITSFDLIYVRSNRLDKEKDYIASNIQSTKNAYEIDVEETSLEYTGTLTEEEVAKNEQLMSNTPIVTQEAVTKTLQDKQTSTGYYNYRDAKLAQYKINGNDQLIYISPREIVNSGRTYTNKTYEYTHGTGQIVASATETTDTGDIEYLQKDVSGKDDILNTSEQRIYFGMSTDETIATNAKNKKEYDYTDEEGIEHTSNYNGQAGLKLNFLDRLILAISKKDLNLAFSSEITEESKILINRNIIKRAKKAMPYLLYDEEPYTVVTNEGKIVWVLDAYTTSNQYPYSQQIDIEHDNRKQRINYIRNSVKVIIDAFDGTITYYITDKSDPMIMAYNNMYPNLFKEQIPEDIAEHFTYPKFLYKVQAELLKTYHNAKPDILYRSDDLWDFAKYNNTKIAKSSGGILEPYYTVIKNGNQEQIGLIQIYTPKSKQNLISYLVGVSENGKNKLKLYKFSEDSNVVGPMQLEKQIQQDEAISNEIEELNTTGIKITKEMIVMPIENTILYIEPIYQTKLNETKIPQLKKLVISSGNKVAIGDTLEQALQNLLSRNAVNIEVENTEDIDGLIESIIKANKNLTESSNNNDWEMIGKDLQRLQELINSLESTREEQEKEQEENQNTTDTNNTIANEITNTTNTTNTMVKNTSVYE